MSIWIEIDPMTEHDPNGDESEYSCVLVRLWPIGTPATRAPLFVNVVRIGDCAAKRMPDAALEQSIRICTNHEQLIELYDLIVCHFRDR